MFGGFNMGRALQKYREATPGRTVTREEFIGAAKAAGWEDHQIGLHIRIATVLGSAVAVGTEMLTIK